VGSPSRQSQFGTDGDGIGNAGECDFNQDEFCSGPDFSRFVRCFNQTLGGNRVSAAADMHGDGFLGVPDFSLGSGFHDPAGPSAH